MDSIGRLEEVGEIVGIRSIGDAVVCCRDQALRGIVQPGEFGEGDPSLPLKIIAPTRDGKERVTITNGHSPCQSITDVPFSIRIDIV